MNSSLDSRNLVLAFGGGSSISTDDNLFLSVAWFPDPGAQLRFSTLAAHADTNPSTLAVTTVQLDAGGGDQICSHSHELPSLSEGLSRFAAAALAGLVESDGPPSSCAALLQCIETAGMTPAQFPSNPSTHFVVGHGTSFSTGPKVWPAAVGLCNYMAASLSDRLRGARVLELGCGLGLPGVLAALLGAERSLLTDSGTDVEFAVEVMLDTVFPKLHQAGCLQFANLEWGTAPTHKFLSNLGEDAGFDIIICCDCVYEPFFGEESWQVLADTLAVLLLESSGAKQAPMALLSVERRIEGIDGVDSFCDALKTHGLSVDCVVSAGSLKGHDLRDVEVWLVVKSE